MGCDALFYRLAYARVKAPYLRDRTGPIMLSNLSLDDSLVEARENYAIARPHARQAHEAACAHLPGGNTRTVLFHGPFPLRAARGEGPYLYDTDGHRYVNLLGEYTAGVFGHSHPVIKAALADAIELGLNLGAHNEAEADLAALVTARFPAMERVRFTNSGTEANLMAVATARAVTARDAVMVFKGGYHGGLMYFKDGIGGVNAPFSFILGTYNDIEDARALIREAGDTLACAILEPMLGSGGCIPADPAFLKALREETAASGALLIFDEVMTSRFGPNGAGALAGVAPDLMTLGKWVGGGMSFGAFGGRREIMDVFDPTRPGSLPHAGTFNNNILSMKAGIAALTQAFTASEAEALHEKGEALRARINAIFETQGVAMHASGMGSLMTIHGVAGPVTHMTDIDGSNDAAKELLFLDLLARGYYIARRGFLALSIALEHTHLNGFAETIEEIVQTRKAALPRR